MHHPRASAFINLSVKIIANLVPLPQPPLLLKYIMSSSQEPLRKVRVATKPYARQARQPLKPKGDKPRTSTKALHDNRRENLMLSDLLKQLQKLRAHFRRLEFASQKQTTLDSFWQPIA